MQYKMIDFEKDSLSAFERLLQGYQKAKESSIWIENMDDLVTKMTYLPNDPFSRELIELFKYHYTVLSEDIGTIIDKALILRGQMENKQRFVTIKQKFYNNLFLPRNTFLKSLRVFNHEGIECYLVKSKIHIDFTKLVLWIIRYGKYKFHDVFSFKQRTIQFHNLDIYHYSQYINLSNTNREDYYHFFCDYYSKLQLINYIDNKHSLKKTTQPQLQQLPTFSVQNLSTSQQVLWAYFFFRLMGLKLRVNTDASTLTRFLHIINNIPTKGYKKSYYYTLATRAPYIKEDKNLLKDLETVRLHFIQCKLPVEDIEKEIFTLVSN